MLSVNVVSESAFTIDGHGVHSAYLEHLTSLSRTDLIKVSANRPRRADVQHAHTVGPYAMSLLLSGRKRIVTAHLTPGSLTGSLRGDRFGHPPFLRYLARCYNMADVVVAVSHADVPGLVRMGVRRPIRVVPNSVDVQAIRALTTDGRATRQRLGLPQDRHIVVGVGQIQPRKGLPTFVSSARSVPDALFCWVGGMPFGALSARRAQMRRLVAGAPANVRFTGALTRRRVFDYLAAADLFFLPSWHENCPIAVLEAAAARLPILLRDLPTYERQFGDSCAYGDDSTLVDVLRRLLDDPQRRAVLSRRASRMAEESFDSRTRASRLLEVYRESV